ncbi:MAG: single-stranded nucleic acid binding R3H domain [Trebouxia sp. A1-2]|nr:MAG: single-stranded nucleic acid binding R3H domain [Trebouxia sp. A1-2]
MAADVVLSGKSILLLGRPGVGKTTAIRDISSMLAHVAHKRVVIIDTSNEIAGDGDVPHPGIASARRMQVVSGIQHHKSASCSNSESGCNSASNMSNPKAAVEAAASESVAAEPVMMLHTFVCQAPVQAVLRDTTNAPQCTQAEGINKAGVQLEIKTDAADKKRQQTVVEPAEDSHLLNTSKAQPDMTAPVARRKNPCRATEKKIAAT